MVGTNWLRMVELNTVASQPHNQRRHSRGHELDVEFRAGSFLFWLYENKLTRSTAF